MPRKSRITWILPALGHLTVVVDIAPDSGAFILVPGLANAVRKIASTMPESIELVIQYTFVRQLPEASLSVS
jgi:hypothetical protein